jgi:hypothetical protein
MVLFKAIHPFKIESSPQAASFATIQAVPFSAVQAGISCAEFRMYQRGENISRDEAGGLALWSPF